MKLKLEILCLCAIVLIGMFGGPYLWHLSEKEEIDEIEESPIIENEAIVNGGEIRVLLSGNSLGTYDHKQVVVTSKASYIIEEGKKTRTVKAGEKTVFSYKKRREGDRITITGTEKLQVCSIKRADGNPSYRGRLKLYYEQGTIHLVNELLLEEYLYAVLPSEMPVSYGLEALKVQAVCARSYAAFQMERKKYKAYHSDVDDSVASQVYNNTAETKETIRAVQETAGEVLMSQGKVIPAYFFSTSWGHTADSKDVWISDGKTPEYLCGYLQTEQKKKMDLSTDLRVKQFLRNKRTTFDSKSPWYRWQVYIPFVLTHNEWIGTTKEIQVTKRGKSGVVKEIRVTGTKGIRVIQGEYAIRSYLSPYGCHLSRQDGKSVKNSHILPSGCFYFQKSAKGVKVIGGGYGHGVGMSQNGAKRQAELGKGYQEILRYYYTDAVIKKLDL